jgi:hypothetical protein
MGNTNGDLNRGLLGNTISWLLEQKNKGRGKVQAVSLAGKNDDGSDADPLNFLKAQIGVTEAIDFEGLSPEGNLETRIKLLHRAFTGRRIELEGFAKAP